MVFSAFRWFAAPRHVQHQTSFQLIGNTSPANSKRPTDCLLKWHSALRAVAHIIARP